MTELSKDDILEIARNDYLSKFEFSVNDAKDCDINIYGVDTNDAWYVYVHNPHSSLGLHSSHIMIISMTDGTVRYSGSAFDEE